MCVAAYSLLIAVQCICNKSAPVKYSIPVKEWRIVATELKIIRIECEWVEERFVECGDWRMSGVQLVIVQHQIDTSHAV